MSQENQQTRTIEYIANELLARGLTKDQIIRKINEAGFLATLEGVSKVLGSRVTPTSLYRIEYDTTNNNLDFKFLEGKGKPPKPNSVDVDVTDNVIASLSSKKIPILFEGITGTGKTYTLEQVLDAVYHIDNRRILRLNANMSNVLQPYINGQIENGALKLYINRDAARDILALLVDEENRGDTNAVIGLLDSQVTLPSGERVNLGPLIPQLDINGKNVNVYFDEEKIKPIAVYGAQNPSSASYSGTRATDGAVGNRQLKITYPNMAVNSGSATINMDAAESNGHDEFIDFYVTQLSKYLGVNLDTLSKLLKPIDSSEEEKRRANSEYLSLHTFAFDPKNIRNKFIKSAVEGADHIINLTGGDGLAQNLEDDLEVAEKWTEILRSYGVDFTYNVSFDPTSEVIKKVDAVRSTFGEPLIERDKTKAIKNAEALALIMWYKQAYANARELGTSPLDEFAQLRSPLTLKDIACAYAIVLNDKMQRKNGASPITLINQAFKDYVSLYQDFATKVYQEQKTFNIHDPDMSIRYLASYMAVSSIKNEDKLTPDEYAKKMITTINNTSAMLKTLDDGNDTRKLLIARINADLASLAGFIHEYRRELADSFSKVPQNATEVLPRYNALKDLVEKARSDVRTNYTLPRVERTFGI